MNSDPIYKKRLRVLSRHLENDKLLLDRWDFLTTLKTKLGDFFKEPPCPCETVGCAIGETTLMQPHLETKDVQDFYGLETAEYKHLFFPYSQETECFGGIHLGRLATKLEAAKQINTFLKRIKKDEQPQPTAQISGS